MMRTSILALALGAAVTMLVPAISIAREIARPSATEQHTAGRPAGAGPQLQAQGKQAAIQPTPEQLREFNAFVEQVRTDFKIPGIAVAIVSDGKVVLERGYGTRELGKPEPVDQNTMFPIASNTKAFTAASIMMLAEEGKLNLDDRVVDHLPWFLLSDPKITYEIRVRDLLSHRNGLEWYVGDLLYWPASSYTSREVSERLANIPIRYGFRQQHAYQNILYGVAQQVIEKASQQSFRDFLQQRFFSPMNMGSTRFNSDALKPGDNVATGHSPYDFDLDNIKPVPDMSWNNRSAAGGLYSSAHDLSKWLRLQLNGGVVTGDGEVGKRLFSQQSHDLMWSTVSEIGAATEAWVPGLARALPTYYNYGMGWFLSDYRGHDLVMHGGTWIGAQSRVTMVPASKTGIVVLTNQDQDLAAYAIVYRALDMMTGEPSYDWLSAYRAAGQKNRDVAREEWDRRQAERQEGTVPSLPLARYAGRYRDKWYGDVNIGFDGTRLTMQFAKTRQLVGDLVHWQLDTYLVRWRDRTLNADALVTFNLDANKNIKDVKMVALFDIMTNYSYDFHDLTLEPVVEPGPGKKRRSR